ncbi:MAG: DUF6188 family protein [Micromonosporaceae bacterium]
MDDRWLLPYREMSVAQVQVSHQLTLVLDGGASVDLETEAELGRVAQNTPGVATARLVPDRQDVAPALSLFGAEILSAVAFKSGGLRFVFDSGQQLRVKPDSHFEAWGAIGPGTIRVVSQPGGGLAVWR